MQLSERLAVAMFADDIKTTKRQVELGETMNSAASIRRYRADVYAAIDGLEEPLGAANGVSNTEVSALPENLQSAWELLFPDLT